MQNVFLVAYYFMRPVRRAHTQIKGWSKDPANIQYDEQIVMTRRLKNKDLETSKIILNLTDKKIVKDGWQSSKTFDEYFEYFLKNYPQYTATAMAELDPEYLVKFQPKVENKDKDESGSSLSST